MNTNSSIQSKANMSYKSKLNEYCQKNGIPPPTYTVKNRDGPSHRPSFSVTCDVAAPNCHGWDGAACPTKKEAEEDVARRVCHSLCIVEREEVEAVEAPEQDPVIVLIDGDNVHEVTDWILRERKGWEIHVFVTQNSVVRQKGVKIYRSYTDLPNATDVRMMIATQGFLPTLRPEERLVLVSRDSIFRTFVGELGSKSVLLAKTIEELRGI